MPAGVPAPVTKFWMLVAVLGSLYSGCSRSVPLTVPPASVMSVLTSSIVSGATSSLVTTRRTVLAVSAPSTSAGATASPKASAVSSCACSCCVRSSRERLSCSRSVTWPSMSAWIGSLSAVVPMMIPSATARKTAISETRW
jgi:hypothetical protein